MSTVQTYGVDVVFHGRDQNAQAMADKLGVSLTGLQGHLDRAAGMFERVGVAAAGLGLGAAAGGLRALLYGVTNLNANARETEIGIAGMLQAGGSAGTFAEGMTAASEVLTQIRRDADALPGEAQDFVNVFRTALPAALDAGLTNALDASRFTNQFGAVAVAFQVDSGQAGRDLRQLLQGRAGADVAMWNNLQSLIGKSAKEFNHLTAPQRLAALQTATGRYGDMIGAFGGTFGTALSTVESKAKDLLRTASEPLYESATRHLQTMGGYLTTHGPRFEAQLARWGQRGADAFDRIFDRGRHAVTYLREHWRELADDALAKGRQLATVYGALRIGSAGLGATQAGASLLGGLGGEGSAALLAALPAMGVAALVVTAGLGAMAVAIQDGQVDVGAALSELKPPFNALRGSLAELGTAARPLIDTVGKQMFENFVAVASVSLRVANELVQFETAVLSVTTGLLGLGIKSPTAQERQLLAGPNAAGLGLNSWWSQQQRDRGNLPETDPAAGAPVWGEGFRRPLHHERRDPRASAHRTNINQTFNFKIEQADSPERVALAVAHVMRNQLRNPTQPASAGLVRLRP